MTVEITRFYDSISDRYHLLHDDRSAWLEMTGTALDGLIGELIGPARQRVLDCSCGIGTQALALAARGHAVTGTDLSEAALQRTAREAEVAGLRLRTAVADMRRLREAVQGPFDVVLSCDNSIAHLERSELPVAFAEMHALLQSAGVVLVSVRDYEPLVAQRPRFMSPAAAPDGGSIAFQLWEWAGDGSSYALQQFFLEEVDGRWETTCERTRLHAHARSTVLGALTDAGLEDVRWHPPAETGYYQPIATGRRA
ncbi:MAG: class I SAM-dependent methyltransferase [Gaiellales bacterium]